MKPEKGEEALALASWEMWKCLPEISRIHVLHFLLPFNFTLQASCCSFLISAISNLHIKVGRERSAESGP